MTVEEEGISAPRLVFTFDARAQRSHVSNWLFGKEIFFFFRQAVNLKHSDMKGPSV